MNDLRNIAQQLRLPADQLRIAADLLEQGYQPAFIARYRADEAGNLPGSLLWSLKFALERQHQLNTARQEAIAHLGEGVELDDEGRERIERAQTTVDIDVVLRCFRARRAARQSGERSGQASELLEKMIAASTPIADLPAWAAEQMSIPTDQGEALIQQSSRLIASLLAGDTRLMERMRLAIQKKATIKVEMIAETPPKAGKEKPAAGTATGQTGGAGGAPAGSDDSAGDTHDHDASGEAWAHHDDDDLVGDHHDLSEHTAGEHAEHSEHAEHLEHADHVEPGQQSQQSVAAEETQPVPSAQAQLDHAQAAEASAAGPGSDQAAGQPGTSSEHTAGA